MKREDVQADLTAIAFDFFYWFSRFEFALKENGYLKSTEVGAKAEPGWDSFIEKWKDHYSPSDEAQVLISESPKRQTVGPGSSLDWKAIDIKRLQSDLERVVALLKTVRNNLFHGGKHGGDHWDDPQKTKVLLLAGVGVLNELATLADLESDYTQFY
jgi:hypothetical protein